MRRSSCSLGQFEVGAYCTSVVLASAKPPPMSSTTSHGIFALIVFQSSSISGFESGRTDARNKSTLHSSPWCLELRREAAVPQSRLLGVGRRQSKTFKHAHALFHKFGSGVFRRWIHLESCIFDFRKSSDPGAATVFESVLNEHPHNAVQTSEKRSLMRGLFFPG